ncbi:hypothetical protein D3C80_1916940 [compost metagenome]
MASVAITRGLAAAWPAVARASIIISVLSFMVSPLKCGVIPMVLNGAGLKGRRLSCDG